MNFGSMKNCSIFTEERWGCDMKRIYKEKMTSITCENCNNKFERLTSYVSFQERKGKKLRFCSRSCMGIGQRMNLCPDIFQKNSIPVPFSGCWIWTGKIWESNGYGRIARQKTSGGNIGAHRASYIVHKGEIPKNEVIRHICDTPLCVNPDHLITGTVLDNKRDAVERKRHAHGETSGNAQLEDKDIPKIRSLLKSGISQSEIARKFGVSHGVIFRIHHGVTWKHIPCPN